MLLRERYRASLRPYVPETPPPENPRKARGTVIIGNETKSGACFLAKNTADHDACRLQGLCACDCHRLEQWFGEGGASGGA